MEESAIVNENSTVETGMSLKWKWALGSAVGFFLITICFTYVLITAFTSQMILDERKSVQESMTWVTQRLKTTDFNKSSPSAIEDDIIATHHLSEKQAPGLIETMRTDMEVHIYDLKQQRYPRTSMNQKPPKAAHIKVTQDQHRQKIIIGWQTIYNQHHQPIGQVEVINYLDKYHRIFKRITLIAIVTMILGVLLIAIWGYWLAQYLLRPVQAIRKVVNATKLDPQSQQRVELDYRHNDELTELATLLNNTLDQLQSVMLMQHQFVEDVSHELRTPVAIVKGHMELLNRWGKDDPKILAESIDASLSEMRRMEGLVQEMLDLTRADQVELAFKGGNTDVKELVNAVYNNFKLVYEDFIFILDDDLRQPVYVNMSRDHLEQVLIILSDNAAKYSKDRREIHYSVAQTASQVQITVQDFGEGVAPEDAKRVFDRFYRVDKARSRKQGGNGLGLSIARKLIEGYGGKIVLESALGYGSIFRITLPIKRKE
ncbi:hypothetical protein IV73_GL000840 [Weissella kandleri]|uniref:Signal transduction histidine-protein kinase ArlS n=1 Tax=Weissella kandleri TaxID=1616 RepID=A0A0R2JCM1_9LACO|nr:HAMP domain-containing histidine kinase [Weissella kandleri]KRN75080.1 hypothetical protein IV73_GL000840 [Weissella kandleri]